MKRLPLVRTMLMCLLAGARAWGGAPSVAVINIPEISEKYQKTSELEGRFDSVRRKLNEERDGMKEKIERTKKSLQEEFKPGTDEYRARQKELAMHEAQLQYFVESEGKQVEQGLAESLRSIFDDIQAMVKVVAEEKGIDIVLAADKLPESAGDNPNQVRQQILLQKVLYWSPRVDITGEVVERLNAKYKAAAQGAAPGKK